MRMKLYRSFMLTAVLTGWLATTALAQSRIVTGTVKDPNGAAVPGVNILVKGTATGTSSDGDGKYSMTVPNEGNPILVFSFIGYANEEIEIGTKTVIDVVLKEDVAQLNEVVVTALG